jgi:hypothetical protein
MRPEEFRRARRQITRQQDDDGHVSSWSGHSYNIYARVTLGPRIILDILDMVCIMIIGRDIDEL